MRIDDIEVTAIAAESLGVRSLCTKITTPDISLLLDPSAALSRRSGLLPHPFEYKRLYDVLNQILREAQSVAILSISHYHFDHVRPSFTDFRYTFGSLEQFWQLFEGKIVFAKDNRSMINFSQRKRGYFFEKNAKEVAEKIEWVDGKTFEFGKTRILYSSPLPHGPEGTPLGYVLATTIDYDGTRVTFAPDVQGPVSDATRDYLLSLNPRLLIIGGPPIYIPRFSEHIQQSLNNLTALVSHIPKLVVDHHLLRSPVWDNWIAPAAKLAQESGSQLMTMATLSGKRNDCLEAKRRELYSDFPPLPNFMAWLDSSDEFQKNNMPPLEGIT